MEYEYNSSPTQKDFDDLIKELPTDYRDDMTIAQQLAIQAYVEMEERKLRCTGRTTRIVDSIIQDLFNKPGKWIPIRDHLDSNAAHENLHKILMRRIRSEHKWLVDSALFEHSSDSRAVRLVIDPKKLDQINKRLNGEG